MGTAVFLAAGVMAFGAGCLARSRYERDCLVTEEYRIASEKIHGQGKTIVFLTDLHNKEFGEENSRLLETVRKVKRMPCFLAGTEWSQRGEILMSGSRWRF